MQMKNLCFFSPYLLGRFFTEACLVIPCSFLGSSCTQVPSQSQVFLGPEDQFEAGLSVKGTLGGGPRAPQEHRRVGSSEKGWLFLFSVSLILISTSVGFFYTERGKPHPQTFLGLFCCLKLHHLVTSSHWGHGARTLAFTRRCLIQNHDPIFHWSKSL